MFFSFKGLNQEIDAESLNLDQLQDLEPRLPQINPEMEEEIKNEIKKEFKIPLELINAESENVGEGGSSQGSTKIQERREKGRIRSKMSRDRKKNYIQKLEKQCEELKKENFRLQNLLIGYRSEHLKKVDSDSRSYLQYLEEMQKEMFKKFVDLDKMDYKEGSPPIKEAFNKNYLASFGRHQKFIDGAFELIIKHPFPLPRIQHWHNLPKEYPNSYNTIKKLERQSKYQVDDYMKENNLNEKDQFLASLSLTKKQFSFFTKVSLAKENEFKQKTQEAIGLLLKAKEIFEEVNTGLFAHMKAFINSGILKDQQMIKARVSEERRKKITNLLDVWDIKVKKKEYEVNLEGDKQYMGYFKDLKEEDKRTKLEYNHYYVDNKTE